MKKLFMRIWVKIFGGQVVWLKDFDGEVSLSIARLDPWGVTVAQRYWPLNLRTVVLLPDGAVDDGCYVKSWKLVE